MKLRNLTNNFSIVNLTNKTCHTLIKKTFHLYKKNRLFIVSWFSHPHFGIFQPVFYCICHLQFTYVSCLIVYSNGSWNRRFFQVYKSNWKNGMNAIFSFSTRWRRYTKNYSNSSWKSTMKRFQYLTWNYHDTDL